MVHRANVLEQTVDILKDGQKQTGKALEWMANAQEHTVKALEQMGKTLEDGLKQMVKAQDQMV